MMTGNVLLELTAVDRRYDEGSRKLVILDGPGDNVRVPGLLPVALLACPHELDLPVIELYLGSTKILKKRHGRSGLEAVGHLMRQFNPIPHRNDVGILRWPADQLVADKSPDQKTGYAKLSGCHGYFIEYEQLFLGANNIHKRHKCTSSIPLHQLDLASSKAVYQLLIADQICTLKMA